jgi:hypothetical protein
MQHTHQHTHMRAHTRAIPTPAKNRFPTGGIHGLIHRMSNAFPPSAAEPFDEPRASALVQDLGRTIITSPKFIDVPWDQIAVVFNLDQQERAYGYRYWGRGEWEAASPSFDAIDIAIDLQSAMQVAGQAPWKMALVRICQPDTKVGIDFDYDGGKWAPDMADPAGFALSLRLP